MGKINVDHFLLKNLLPCIFSHEHYILMHYKYDAYLLILVFVWDVAVLKKMLHAGKQHMFIAKLVVAVVLPLLYVTWSVHFPGMSIIGFFCSFMLVLLNVHLLCGLFALQVKYRQMKPEAAYDYVKSIRPRVLLASSQWLVILQTLHGHCYII